MRYPHTAELRTEISRRLRDFQRKPVESQTLRHAAVAVCVVPRPHDDASSVLLTLRTGNLQRHSGQYALPGGRVDKGETALQAALRELSEELGIECGTADIVGLLDDYPTRSGYRITPVVIVVPGPPNIVPEPGEVAEVYHIPLDELDSDAIPHFTSGVAGGPPVLYSQLPTLGGMMFAPTAAMLFQFREVALRGKSTRVAHFDQPAFAWQ